MPNTVLYW